MAGKTVAGDRYFDIDGKLHEITRQLRQRGGYPFDLDLLEQRLQDLIEGKFDVPHILENFGTIEATGTDRWSFWLLEQDREQSEGGAVSGWLADNVWINQLTPGFVTNFYGKTDSNVMPTTLRVQRVRRKASTGQILSELGGTAEITLFQMCEVLKAEGKRNAKHSFLAIGGVGCEMSYFYIRASGGRLFEVSVRANYPRGSELCWTIVAKEAHLTREPIGIGCRVFSH